MSFFLLCLLCSPINGEAISEPIISSEMSQSLYALSVKRHEASVIKATQAKAQALYGNDAGYIGVTNKIIAADTGQRFLLIKIKPDGNCGFYSLGITRDQFTKAIEAYINEHDDNYMSFLNKRTTLEERLQINITKDELERIEQEFKALANEVGLDNESSEINKFNEPFQALLNNFESQTNTEKKEYLDSIKNSISNLSYPGYEAFLELLIRELKDSGEKQSDITSSKQALIRGVRKVFAKNAGMKSWLPADLIWFVKDKLRLKYNIWSDLSSSNRPVKVIATSSKEGQEMDSDTRHLFYTPGIHYDMLIPLDF